MVGIDGFNPYASAAGGAEEVFRKIIKEEEKKGKNSKILSAIRSFHIAHEKVKEEVADALSQEIGEAVKPDNPMVNEALFGLSLNKIFERTPDGEEILAPDLKSSLQKYESESEEAKEAVSTKLSQGSKGRVPKDDKLIARDLDEISWRTTQKDDLLFS